jgi:hypothetical protein
MFSITRLAERIRAEYAAMPGLKLTREQVCRLWGVDSDTCAAALDTLLADGLLHQTGTGKYVALPRPAGAGITVELEEGASSAVIRCPHCAKRNIVELSQTVGGSIRCAGCQRIMSPTKLSA